MKNLFHLTAAVVAFTTAAPLFAGVALAKPNLNPSVSTPQAADRTILIKNTTKTVNVFENETVLFKVGAKAFALRFDGNNAYYDLQTLAPPGVLTRKIKVVVAPNPKDHVQGIP